MKNDKDWKKTVGGAKYTVKMGGGEYKPTDGMGKALKIKHFDGKKFEHF